MGIGAGIFLIALGAILTFAVDWQVHGVDLHAVGWVLMVAGVAGIVLYFVFWNSRRRPQAVAARPVAQRPVEYVDQAAPVYPTAEYPPSTPPGV